jgi:hypothetical protein
MKLKLMLAGLTLAATAWAQTEQWLEYHTSDDGRSFIQIQLTTNPPASLALPKLNATPYFAHWNSPLDPTGGRWLCFDRSRPSGPYDRLFIDSTGNGRLDDKTPVLARSDAYYAYFPATPLVFKGEDGPITYHLVLRLYQNNNSRPMLMGGSGGWYEGLANFDGVKKRIQLIDGNVNGTFNDVKADLSQSDRVQIDGDKVQERYLGRMVEVDGKLFRIEVARDGSSVKVQKAENVTLGSVQVPQNISEFTAFGENGYFVRKATNGEFTLPVGKYRMVHWTINRKDDKGAAWTLSGHDFPATANFDVTADDPTTLDIGEPVQAILKVNEQTNHDITFNLSFIGRQKEAIEMLREGQRPGGPKLTLANADGSLCATSSFEFG